MAFREVGGASRAPPTRDTNSYPHLWRGGGGIRKGGAFALSVCGARQKRRLSVQARFLPTAAHAYAPLYPPPAARGNAALASASLVHFLPKQEMNAPGRDRKCDLCKCIDKTQCVPGDRHSAARFAMTGIFGGVSGIRSGRRGRRPLQGRFGNSAERHTGRCLHVIRIPIRTSGELSIALHNGLKMAQTAKKRTPGGNES